MKESANSIVNKLLEDITPEELKIIPDKRLMVVLYDKNHEYLDDFVYDGKDIVKFLDINKYTWDGSAWVKPDGRYAHVVYP